MSKDFYSLSEVADLLSVSKETLRRWDRSGKLVPIRHPINSYRVYPADSLRQFDELGFLFHNKNTSHEKPLRAYRCIELFAGAGGLALGLEQAGIESVLLNETDKHACSTLRVNRPNWNVAEGDVAKLNFKNYRGKVDLVTGGFPCQAFSYAGKNSALKILEAPYFLSLLVQSKKPNPLLPSERTLEDYSTTTREHTARYDLRVK